MPQKNQDKINKLQNFEQDKDLAMFDEIQDISEALGNFKNVEMVKIKGNKGDEGDKGDKGETGKDGKDGKDAKKVKDGKDGKNGIDGKNGVDGKDGVNGKDGEIKNLSPEEVRDSLELLEGKERLDKSSIRGLEKTLKELEKRIKKGGVGHGGAPNNSLQVADLTSQCDGITKEFSVPLHRKAIKVESTQFPIVYRPDTDFTTANYTLTLTSEVGAPQTGQTLIFYYIK